MDFSMQFGQRAETLSLESSPPLERKSI